MTLILQRFGTLAVVVGLSLICTSCSEAPKSAPKSADPVKVAPAPKTDGPKLDAPKSEPAKSEPKKEEPKAEVKKEEPKKELPKVEAPKAEPAQEAPKSEPKKEMPKLDAPKSEPAKTEPTKEAPKVEPKKEEPKAEVKKEEPKKEAPKLDPPKSEPTKETPKTEPKKDEPKKEGASAAPAAAAVATVAAKTSAAISKPAAGPLDWNQWGGSPHRNNTPQGKNIPAEFDPGEFDDDGNWKPGTGENLLWVAAVGSQTYGNPVVANGKIYVGTNNGHGYLTRYPATVDLGCLVCFNEKDGKFLWQHSSEKLPTGRVHDWPLQGICCSPYIEGDRLWFVTSRGEVMCLDTEGFADNENDGPFTGEKLDNEKDKPHEADVIWVFDMMKDLGVSQHNMCSCSVTATGDTLWVCTSNGVDESHINLPAPAAPSFLAIDKHTGKVIWKDGSPGNNILHGQWSSPAVATLGGVPQVMFAGGDSWLYSFKADRTPEKPELLWEFDANPKATEYILGGRGTRNEIICTPVVYDNKIYIAVGQDPEHGEGVGHLWCIDPSKRGDVSAELAVEVADRNKKLPKRRLKAIENPMAETPVSNPNSAVVWHYSEFDQNADKKIDFEETMHRTIGTPAIKDDILYIPDFSGLVHCVDAQTGKPYWTHDLFAATWGSALIVDGKVYVGDEEGKLTIFKHGKEKEILAEIDMKNSIYSSPIVANNTLYIVNKTHLFAFKAKD